MEKFSYVSCLKIIICKELKVSNKCKEQTVQYFPLSSSGVEVESGTERKWSTSTSNLCVLSKCN